MVTSRMTEQIGRVLGDRYRLIAPIGTGASAQVYLADDVRLRRRVAVKVLHAGLAEDESFLRRFRAEARSAAALSHPHIVAVYDWNDDDIPYIVSEYLGGGSLRAMLDAGHLLTPSQALIVGLEASRALDYAHRRGVVHRDIKPANLLFGDDRRLRVADLGLARALAEAAWTEPAGAMLGTARYASPEQAKGEQVDGKSDVYALALVLIEAVTGTVPFAVDTTIGTLMARVDKTIDVPDSLGPLKRPIERAGNPDPAARPDAGELAVALLAAAEQLERPEPLPLAGAIAHDDAPVDDRDPTVLAATTLATEGLDLTVADGMPAVTDRAAGPPDDVPLLVSVPDDDRPTWRRRLSLIAVTIVMALIVGIGGGYAWVNVRSPAHEVPDLTGKTVAEARALVDELGFDVEERDAREDGSTVGMILRTDPPGGERLREGETLVLFVSQGNTLRTVPTDLKGKKKEAAVALLADAGLKAKITEAFDEKVAAGIVMDVVTTATEVPKDSAVELKVSKGAEPRTIPDGFRGKKYDEVAKALEALDLKPKKVEEFSDDVDKGKVVGTRPGEGDKAAKGSEVEVIVSRGPDIVTVPDVRGDSLEEATEELEDAGLEVGDVIGGVKGEVFATNPEADDKVRRGTSVDLYMRR